MSVDYDKLEADDAALDAEIQGMFQPQPTPESSDTVETTTIDAAPSQDTAVGDQNETEPSATETAEETVPKSRYDNAVSKMTKSSMEAAELRRANDQMQQELQQLRSENQQLKDQLQTKETAPPDTSPSVDLELYPELEPLLLRNQQLEQKLALLEKNMQGVYQTAEDVKKREEEQKWQNHFNAIYSAHPDADDVVSGDAFNAWVQTQPPIMQAILQQGTAKDVVYLLDQYKGKDKPVVDKLSAARQAATPKVSGQKAHAKPQRTLEEIAKINPRDWNDELDAEADELIRQQYS